MMLRNKRGFTLIELLVVMIIVGILAAVSIPLLSGNIAKARKSEAITAMGAIRTALKAYTVINSTAALNAVSFGQLETEGLLTQASVDGTYFSRECYGWDANGNITCNAGISNVTRSPRAGDVTSYTNTILYWNGWTVNY